MSAHSALQSFDLMNDHELYCLSEHDSLPSLAFSENTHDDCLIDMNDQDDINEVLDDVIIKINRITDHLRSAGENEAANHFTRDMTGTFRSLYNVIAPWDIQKCMMRRPQSAITNVNADANTTSAPNPALASNTWASIAASEPVADKNGIIKFRPSDAVRTTFEPSTGGNRSDPRDQRVVWVRPWPVTRELGEISKEMAELGPIYSIAFAPEEKAVCIIFQHAPSAQQFLQNCAMHTTRDGVSPFGKGHDITPGLPYPMDNGIRRMEPPTNARRRLTFARSQLFTNGMTESRFRTDIEAIVGSSNIELLWLFNTGNATVVFSAVPLAKMVKEKFLGFGRSRNSIYEGIMVAYSHDPCERELHLVSQIPGHANFIGSNSKDNLTSASRPYRCNTTSTERSSGRNPLTSFPEHVSLSKRRNITARSVIDKEGWQTVKKRR